MLQTASTRYLNALLDQRGLDVRSSARTCQICQSYYGNLASELQLFVVEPIAVRWLLASRTMDPAAATALQSRRPIPGHRTKYDCDAHLQRCLRRDSILFGLELLLGIQQTYQS